MAQENKQSVGHLHGERKVDAAGKNSLTRKWSLKVEGNEKLGGSRSWLLVEGDTGLWLSMSVCFLM